MKKALVCGAGGFIGFHLAHALKEKGYYVRAVDIKEPEFAKSTADEFLVLDLREKENCTKALTIDDGTFDEVYQLAADMGGMGFIHAAECEIMINSALINIYMTTESSRLGVPRYFFSSSACVYPDMEADADFMTEEDAYPAFPDNEYGWEKLYAERIAETFARNEGMIVRIARFQNCYGPLGTWRGGREKAPAALSRKVACVQDGGSIDVWGDGSAMRSYTYVDDIVNGVIMLMHSDINVPVNIGSEEFVSVNELVATIAKVSGKKIAIKHIEGPVGVQARNHTFDKMKSIGWEAKFSLEEGMKVTYNWVKEQVEETSHKEE